MDPWGPGPYQGVHLGGEGGGIEQPPFSEKWLEETVLSIHSIAVRTRYKHAVRTKWGPEQKKLFKIGQFEGVLL